MHKNVVMLTTVVQLTENAELLDWKQQHLFHSQYSM